jgi:hypothetical protein
MTKNSTCSIAKTSLNTATTSTPPTTSPAVATLLISIREAQCQISELQALIDEHKTHLQDLFDEGFITDSVSHDGITAKIQQRKTWQYSPAIKELQDMEQVEGIATQKVSSSWHVRFSSPEA